MLYGKKRVWKEDQRTVRTLTTLLLSRDRDANGLSAWQYTGINPKKFHGSFALNLHICKKGNS